MPGNLFSIDKKAGGVNTGLRHESDIPLTKTYTVNKDIYR